MANYYDRETKLAYVEQYTSGKMTAKEVMRELGCSKSALYSWVSKFTEDPEHALPGSGRMKPDEQYVRNLEKENRELKNEVEFLKKAAAYFAVDQRKSTR
ncbi:MAG: transposase [Sphaerochaetaceae bacterium]|jgi:transposase|nr:transposase [Sphaerochaetaceae bacterium]